MKSTFYFKAHPKHVDEICIEADEIEFMDGWVIFYQYHPSRIEINGQTLPIRRIIQARHRETCNSLREVLNE